MELSQDLLTKLLTPQKLWSRVEILDRNCQIPPEQGIYAWYFKDYPPIIPDQDCHRFEDMTLLYLGIAPSRHESDSNLRKRLRQHMNGNAYGSTLRFSLGCLLELELRRVSNTRATFLGEDEQKLSQWLHQNAFVTWQVVSKPWQEEAKLISKLCLPLNIKDNKKHAFYPTLTSLRKQARKKAKQLPIVSL